MAGSVYCVSIPTPTGSRRLAVFRLSTILSVSSLDDTSISTGDNRGAGHLSLSEACLVVHHGCHRVPVCLRSKSARRNPGEDLQCRVAGSLERSPVHVLAGDVLYPRGHKHPSKPRPRHVLLQILQVWLVLHLHRQSRRESSRAEVNSTIRGQGLTVLSLQQTASMGVHRF